MDTSSTVDRRGFIAANVAIAGAATLPQVAAAATEAVDGVKPMNWAQATATQMVDLIGERFRVTTPEGEHLVVQLAHVDSIYSGIDRPEGLPRSEGVSLLFQSADMAPMVQCGHVMHRFSHPRLGAADLLAGPVCNRDGSHLIELVLN